MLWELAGSSLGVRRRNKEACWKHTGRSLKEDHKTHCKNVGGCQIDGSSKWRLDRPSRWLYRLYPVFRVAFDDSDAGAGSCITHTQFFQVCLNFGSNRLKLNGVYKYPKFSCI
ncbi:hypothetical protein B296_00051531 [Ensete ventricosum]|uniref:Uncharacterized protein n=1 Tax=Ensete ventricosum TaxID=4639 RepID=A0A426XCU6_ENSVE|nr:hypothetical protein B296_00051531 [Ensete ventricosum]